MNFQKLINSARECAMLYISQILCFRTGSYELCDPSLYEDEYDLSKVSEMKELPYWYYKGKLFVFVLIDIDPDNNIILKGLHMYSDLERDFAIEDLTSDCIAQIADLVWKLENNK